MQMANPLVCSSTEGQIWIKETVLSQSQRKARRPSLSRSPSVQRCPREVDPARSGSRSMRGQGTQLAGPQKGHRAPEALNRSTSFRRSSKLESANSLSTAPDT